ncbi:MAG: YdcF family protein [Clostridia bacterium]|nr:YdcF family protein [Clostridia bacterium]
MQPQHYAEKIWDYHHMNHTLENVDCIIVLGSHDTRVAERGAEIFLKGLAPLIVFSGYLGAFTQDAWERAEAEIFAEIAVNMGVPKDKILIENKSTNTGENVIFSKSILAEAGIFPKKVIAVQKPYMERRTYATFKNFWPELEVLVTSPLLSFWDYPNETISMDAVIHIMVGDLQRIMEYPQKGYQISQEVPDDIYDAYQKLVKMGYTGHLIK